jgi:hypothetical protein
MKKIKKIVKVLVLFALIFVKTTAAWGQTKIPSNLIGVIKILDNSKVKEITDASLVDYIGHLSDDDLVKNGLFTKKVYIFNDITFSLNIRPSIFVDETYVSCDIYRAGRIDGFAIRPSWFDLVEGLEIKTGAEINGVLFIQNSGVDARGYLFFGNKKPLDPTWLFLCYHGVPMFKITGGLTGPCFNLIRCTFVEGWTGKEPEKQKQPEPKEYLNLPCDNQKIEMGEYEVSNDTVYGRISKDGRYYYHYSDGVWYKNNNGNWDKIICPQTQEVKTTSVVYQEPVFVIACDNTSYKKEGYSINGYEMYNFGEIAFKNGQWYKKRPDGVFDLLCKAEFAEEEPKKEGYYEVNKTKYTFSEEPKVIYVVQQSQPAQTTLLQRVGNFFASGYVNFSMNNRNNYNGYGYQNGYQNGYRNHVQLVPPNTDGPFDKPRGQ